MRRKKAGSYGMQVNQVYPIVGGLKFSIGSGGHVVVQDETVRNSTGKHTPKP